MVFFKGQQLYLLGKACICLEKHVLSVFAWKLLKNIDDCYIIILLCINKINIPVVLKPVVLKQSITVTNCTFACKNRTEKIKVHKSVSLII